MAALVLAAALPASATSLVRMSLDQLTQAASAVIEGRVVSQVSEWNAAHTWIVTLTTVAVDQSVKGSATTTVVVEQPGGTVGRLHVDVPGAMHFYTQARYELFLEPSQANPARFLLVGMREGAYRIYTDAQTREQRVINPVGGVYYRQGGAAQAATMPLAQFQRNVSAALARALVIPRGSTIPVVVRSVSYAGVGRVQVVAETTADVYPSAHDIVPAGSRVDGYAQESPSGWMIHWTAVSVRGDRARFSAVSRAADVSGLAGERFVCVAR